jgi:hypothetical protein
MKSFGIGLVVTQRALSDDRYQLLSIPLRFRSPHSDFISRLTLTIYINIYRVMQMNSRIAWKISCGQDAHSRSPSTVVALFQTAFFGRLV